MAVMTAQPALPMVLNAEATPVGRAVSLSDTAEGGQVFIHGNLCYAWDASDTAMRRLAAVKLVELKAATAIEIAAAFSVTVGTLWNWSQLLGAGGVTALAEEKRGPKKPSKLTDQIIAEVHQLRHSGMVHRAIAASLGISAFSVRRALKLENPAIAPAAPAVPGAGTGEEPLQLVLPLLPAPMDRTTERALATVGGGLECVAPVFAPAARIPHAGLFFALPALETTGLLSCATEVFGSLPNGVYGLETIMLEAVLRTLAGEPRVQGATRLDPEAFGRILGLDRAPEAKTIRRKHHHLADTGQVGDLMTLMASKHLKTVLGTEEDLAAVLYVDGHVRAYQGKKKVGKIHSTRLKFPVPATEETWVCDSTGSPVFMVLAEPSSSLVSELRKLLPSLRQLIGDDRRVLVGFDRGGWSPELFGHMASQGFDVLTWRKGSNIPDIPEARFGPVTHLDEHGETRTWDLVADTRVDLLIGSSGELVSMRQVSRIVPLIKGAGTRQIHILTTLDSMSTGELIYRMGARWRQENYFRYGREHFALDAHDSYASGDDDPERMVPNPAKTKSLNTVKAARAHRDAMMAHTDALMLEASTPEPGTSVLITNQMHNEITAPLRAAQEDVQAVEAAHANLPTRIRLGDLAPGQQVLDTEMKMFTHVIRMASYNTAMVLAREIRTNTGYKRAAKEAHALVRTVLARPGDIDPTIPGVLTIRLDPMPTKSETSAISELCDHLTAAQTLYPGTDLVLRYEIKTRTGIS